MKIFLKYNVPSLFEKTLLTVSASVRNDLVEDIFFDWEKSGSLLSMGSPYPNLKTKNEFIYFNYYYMVLLKEVTKDTEEARLTNNLNLLNILNDYFTLSEIFDQLNITAYYYDDKVLYSASKKFSRDNSFNETLLNKMRGVIESGGKRGLKELVTLNDVFYLYDLLMNYLKEMKQEGGWLSKIDSKLFKHYNKGIQIFMCDYYEKGFLANKTFIPSNVSLYREKLRHDLDMYLNKMKNDLENFSKSSYDSLFEHFELPEEPSFQLEKDDIFLYGKVDSVSENNMSVTYIYDLFQKRKKSFINLHHETLDYIFSLFHFDLTKKFYV